MNDIPRGTSRIALINSLLSPSHTQHSGPAPRQPDVMFGLVMSDSRLDDEQSVAAVDFSNTPLWLQTLNLDPCGFPKKTPLGTIWRGVDLNTIDEHGQTEFIRAAAKGGVDLFYAEMLAEFKDTDVNIQDRQGRTALHWASVEGHADMVRVCLSVPECDIGLKDNKGFTAFDLSLSGTEIIPASFYRSMFEMQDTHPEEALLRALTVTSEPMMGKPDFPGTAIFGPISNSNLRLVRALVDRGIDHTARNSDGDTALHLAAQSGNVEMATVLLEGGFDVNAIGGRGATPLHYAVAVPNNREMVGVFLDWKADIDVEDMDQMLASHWAAENGQLDVARLLLDHGADIEEQGMDGGIALLSPEGHRGKDSVPPDVMEMEEMDIKAEVVGVEMTVESKYQYVDGVKTLHQAAKMGDLEAVRDLLQRGDDKDAVDNDGDTALQNALSCGRIEIVKALLDAGAQVQLVNKYKRTPLHEAACSGYSEIVKMLLEKGAIVDARDEWGETALHDAVRNHRREVALVLLHAGASIKVRGNFLDKSRTVSQLAWDEGNTEMKDIIIGAGARSTTVSRLRFNILRGR